MTFTTSANAAQAPYLPNQRYFPIEGELLQRELNNSFADIAKSVNAREIGMYSQSVTATGQRFEMERSEPSEESKRRILMFGPIAAGATSVLPHNLSGFDRFTRIYGVGQTQNDWRPIPFSSVVAITDQISIVVDRVNVTIRNGATGVALQSALVVVEFI